MGNNKILIFYLIGKLVEKFCIILRILIILGKDVLILFWNNTPFLLTELDLKR
jgi:hypothetical protein